MGAFRPLADTVDGRKLGGCLASNYFNAGFADGKPPESKLVRAAGIGIEIGQRIGHRIQWLVCCPRGFEQERAILNQRRHCCGVTNVGEIDGYTVPDVLNIEKGCRHNSGIKLSTSADPRFQREEPSRSAETDNKPDSSSDEKHRPL